MFIFFREAMTVFELMTGGDQVNINKPKKVERPTGNFINNMNYTIKNITLNLQDKIVTFMSVLRSKIRGKIS